MKKNGPLVFCILALAFLFGFSGCFSSGEPVRHLASDICLVTPNLTREEVLSLLGPPDHRETTQKGEEKWVYYTDKKSLLRKTPYVGERLGSENFQVATITFAGSQVRTCVYRALTEDEFKKLGIPAVEPLEE